MEERRKDFMVYYQFLEPVEKLFYETLRARYPEMTVMDVAVCRAAYIAIRTGGTEMHDRYMIWTFYDTKAMEMARYLLENASLLLGPGQSCRSMEEAWGLLKDKCNMEAKGSFEGLKDAQIFPTKHSFENAVGLAYMRGYLEGNPTDRPFPRVNQEIQKLLDDTLEQSVQSQEYVTDEQVFQHEREQAEFNDRRHA